VEQTDADLADQLAQQIQSSDTSFAATASQDTGLQTQIDEMKKGIVDLQNADISSSTTDASL